TVELPEGTKTPLTDFIGRDLGVANIPTDSDGDRYAGVAIEACCIRNHALRRSLQKAVAGGKRRGLWLKNIRRTLKSVAGGEARFRKDVSHLVSKLLVAKAKGTGRGLALEDLRGIRARTRFCKTQRAKMSGWALHQLCSCIEYKTKREGVALILVNPKNTSRQYLCCGHIAKANRPLPTEFRCVACGHADPADGSAAGNICSRARALVNAPKVSEPQQDHLLVA
ncbi:MAG: transposase, partial [Thermosynechococcus sp. Uc]|uniref:transposase n=1 Tax=Thermosynechococcus sp. Uc TaxID=3034853 RepID=UPI00259D55A8